MSYLSLKGVSFHFVSQEINISLKLIDYIYSTVKPQFTAQFGGTEKGAGKR